MKVQSQIDTIRQIQLQKNNKNAWKLIHQYGLTDQVNQQKQFSYIDVIELQNKKLNKFGLFKELGKRILWMNQQISKNVIKNNRQNKYQYLLYSNLSHRLKCLKYIKDDQAIQNQLQQIKKWFLYNLSKQGQFNYISINNPQMLNQQIIDNHDNQKMYQMGFRSNYQNLYPPKDRLKDFKVKKIITDDKQHHIQQSTSNKFFQSPQIYQKYNYAKSVTTLKETQFPETLNQQQNVGQLEDYNKDIVIQKFQQQKEEEQGGQGEGEEGEEVEQEGVNSEQNKNKLLVNQKKKNYSRNHYSKQTYQLNQETDKILERITNGILIKQQHKSYKQWEERKLDQKLKQKNLKAKSILDRNVNRKIQGLYKVNKFIKMQQIIHQNPEKKQILKEFGHKQNFQKYKIKKKSDLLINNNQDNLKSQQNSIQKQKTDHLQFNLNKLTKSVSHFSKTSAFNQEDYTIRLSKLKSTAESITSKLFQINKLNNKKPILNIQSILPHIVTNNQINQMDNLDIFENTIKKPFLLRTVHLLQRKIDHSNKNKLQIPQLQIIKNKMTSGLSLWAQKGSAKFGITLNKYKSNQYNLMVRNQINEYKNKLAKFMTPIKIQNLYRSQSVADKKFNQKIDFRGSGDALLKNMFFNKNLGKSKKKVKK